MNILYHNLSSLDSDWRCTTSIPLCPANLQRRRATLKTKCLYIYSEAIAEEVMAIHIRQSKTDSF